MTQENNAIAEFVDRLRGQRQEYVDKIKELKSLISVVDAAIKGAQDSLAQQPGYVEARARAGERSPVKRGDIQGSVELYLASRLGAWCTTTEVVQGVSKLGIDVDSRSRRSAVAAALQRAAQKVDFERRTVEGMNNRYEFRFIHDEKDDQLAL